MIYVVAYYENGYCGCDTTDFFTFDDNTTTSEIADYIWDTRRDYADAYAHVHFGWDESYTDEEWEEWVEEYCMVTWDIVSEEDYKAAMKEAGL